MNTDFEEQLRQLEKEYGDSDSEYTEDEDEEYDEMIDEIIEEDELEDDFENLDLDDLYCPACEKDFNHKNAFKNHISSQKHKNNVERLKKEMIAMEDTYKESQQNGKLTDDEDLLEGEEEEIHDKTSKKSKKKKPKPVPVYSDNDDLPELSDDEEILAEEDQLEQTSKKSKKKRKGKPSLIAEDDIIPDFVSKLADDSDWEDKKKNKKGTKKAKQTKVVIAKDVESDKEGDSDFENIKKSKKAKKTNKVVVGDEDEDINHVCVTCKLEFESKNKLFAHLKKMNHGVYIPKKGAAAHEALGAKKKGRK